MDNGALRDSDPFPLEKIPPIGGPPKTRGPLFRRASNFSGSSWDVQITSWVANCKVSLPDFTCLFNLVPIGVLLGK